MTDGPLHPSAHPSGAGWGGTDTFVRGRQRVDVIVCSHLAAFLFRSSTAFPVPHTVSTIYAASPSILPSHRFLTQPSAPHCTWRRLLGTKISSSSSALAVLASTRRLACVLRGRSVSLVGRSVGRWSCATWLLRDLHGAHGLLPVRSLARATLMDACIHLPPRLSLLLLLTTLWQCMSQSIIHITHTGPMENHGVACSRQVEARGRY